MKKTFVPITVITTPNYHGDGLYYNSIMKNLSIVSNGSTTEWWVGDRVGMLLEAIIGESSDNDTQNTGRADEKKPESAMLVTVDDIVKIIAVSSMPQHVSNILRK